MRESRKKPDVPWHVGYVYKNEEDPRRHKHRCVFFEKNECNYTKIQCVGSAHCDFYSEDPKKANQSKQNQKDYYHHTDAGFTVSGILIKKKPSDNKKS